MSDVTETLTIHLPVAAAQRLRRVAEISRRAVDEVIADTLAASLPPLLEDVPTAFQADLATLEPLPTEHLRQHLDATLDPAQLAHYDTLLAAAATRPLTPREQEELAALRLQADRLMFRKAYAAVLLKWRGERVPVPVEPPTSPA